MELSISNIDIFKKVFESIKELDIVDTNFEFTKQGLKIENMDASHTSLVYLNLSKDFFESYTCNTDITVGLNIPVFCKILKACRDTDSLGITKNKNDNFLCLVVSNTDKNQEFELPEMEIDTDKLCIVDKYQYIINIASDVFNRIIHDISVVDGSNVRLTVQDNNILRWSIEGDLGKTSLETKIENTKHGESTRQRLTNSFSINFMKKFIKSSNLGQDKSITLSMENDIPIKLSSDLGNQSEIKFYIAPKID